MRRSGSRFMLGALFDLCGCSSWFVRVILAELLLESLYIGVWV